MAIDNGAVTSASMTGSVPRGAHQTVDHDETYHLIGSDKVQGSDVRRSNGDKIGAIERLMIDKKSGRVAYAVMSFGGFLGLGVNRMPVPWEMLRYREELDAYEMDVSEEQLRGAPGYSDDDGFDWSDPDWNREMRAHYRTGQGSAGGGAGPASRRLGAPAFGL